jgi:hypothetical protein
MDARIDTGFPTHPKTKRLIRRLGLAGAWSLLQLWLWATQNKPSGDLAGMSAEDVEMAGEWQGDPGQLVQVLLDVGYLDDEDGGYQLHDWARRNPWVAGSPMRSAKARWNAVKRHHGPLEADRQVPEWAAARRAAKAAEPPENHATSIENHATSRTRSAPSPSPSPSPKAIEAPTDHPAPPAAVEHSPPAGALAAMTLAGTACRAMREVGCHRTNPGHPDLLAALAEGVTPAVLAATAAEAIDAGKQNPFSYAIATARSRHAAGPKPIARGADHAAPRNHRDGPSSAAARVEAAVRAARAADEADDLEA